MATSKIEICNSALSKLNVPAIASFSENSKAARSCDLQYDTTRRKLLRSHLWNFAIKRAELAKLVDAPLFDYSAAFQLPSDCLRAIKIHTGMPFEEESGKLLTNSSSCKIKYIADVEDVSKFDTIFEEALAYDLAAELSFTFKQSETLRRSMQESALRIIKDARSMDAQTGTLPLLQEDVWLNSRIAGVDGDL